MPEPFSPQVQRNYLDDILDQAYNDLEMERQRQESIIQSDNPDKVLSQQNKVEKQLENEVPEVQQAVRQKVYRPGYFDVSRTAEDILPGKTEKDELPYDDLVARFHEYNEKLAPYTKQEFDRISQEKLGSQRPTTSRMRMADYEGQSYTEEDIKNEAISSAKARLAEEGLIKPKATWITALNETFTDWNKFGKKLPWIGGGGEAREAFGIINAIKDVKDGTADEDDYRVLIETQMEMERDSDWGNMATEIFLTLPGYAIEFASTGSMATGARVATKAGVRKSLNWILSKQGKKLIKEGSESFALRATQGVLGTTVGAVARTINPKTWNRTLGNATQQMIPDYELDQAQNGKIEVIADEFKDWGTALTEGALLTFTENLGEEFGEVFAFGGKEFRAYMKTNPESAVSGLIKSIIRKNPNVPVGKVMQSVRQAGIHSVPVEILEERVTDFLQSGIEGHEFHWPTPEEWLAEIVAIGGFAGGARGIGKIADSRTRKRKESAKQKGLSAIESGTLDQLTNDEMTDFATSLTKEEAMELGVIPDYENQRINYEPESDLGKEMIRRNLEMEKYPETDKEFREAGARANIKEQQMEGRDFVGALMNKVREEAPNIDIQDEYLDRLLSDEAKEKGWTEEEIKQQLRDHGLDEDSDPEKIMITGTSFGGSIRISRAGTEERMVDEYVAVTEEMAEEYYKAEQENNPEFDNEVSNDRKNYHEATGEQDKGESNLEWFSTKAIHFATQGKVHESIGAKLKQIFNRFIAETKAILMDAIRLRKAIKAGKVSDSLLKKLEEATDFKKVGEKVQQAKKLEKLSKKDSFHLLELKNASGYTVDNRGYFGGEYIAPVVLGKDMHEDSAWPIPDGATFILKKININDNPVVWGKEQFKNLTRDQFLADDYDGYQERVLEDIKKNAEESGIKAFQPLIFGYESKKMAKKNQLTMLDGHHRAVIANELGFNEIYVYVQQAKESKKDTSYRAVKAPLSLSNQKYGQLKKLMYQLTEEGEPAKYWYEHSGQALLDITNGDKDLAKKLLSIIAITSPRMDVKTNFGQMIKGYYKVLLGEKPLAGMFPTSMSKKIQEVMDGKEWKGLKTDKFLKNLVAVIDGGSPDVTVDMWMMRAFGIDKDAPTDLEYRTVERLVQDIADDIGWEPFQVQASIWTATKARWEKVYKPLFAKAKKAGLYKDGKWKNKLAEKNFRKRVYREFKKVTITQEEIEKAGFNYKDAIDIYKGRISHEVVPHPTTKVLPKIHKAPYEQQLEYHYAVNGVLSDENGRDIIAGFLGIPEVTSFDSPGFYEESSSPSKHTEVLFSSSVSAYLKPGKLNKVINPETLENIELYSAIRALVTRQKAIGFTKEFESPSKKLANAVTVEVDKGLTTEQLQSVYNGMIDAGIDTGPMPTDYGFILVNFMDNDGNPYSGVSNVSFENIVDNVIEKVFKNENIELTLRSATSLGSLVENDWSKNKHGENYQKRISESGRSSSIRKLVSTLNGEIQQVNEEYSKKYNWGNPGKLEESKETGQRSYHLAPTFYSKAERVVTEQFPPTMKSQSVENFLLKNQVKPEEIQWLDLETLTRNKPKITKEELQDWIQANKIDVQDVMKSEVDVKFPADLTELPGDIKITKSGYGWVAWWGNGSGMQGVEEETKEDAIREALEYVNDRRRMEFENGTRKDAPAHSQYQLPGEKEDYRELLLTLPSKNLYNIIDEYGTVKQRNLPDEESLAIAMGNDDLARVSVGQEKDTFTTGHYEEPNILAHVRFNTRKSPTGEQVLFIEELQSDWHTGGRKHGYKGEPYKRKYSKKELQKIIKDTVKGIKEIGKESGLDNFAPALEVYESSSSVYERTEMYQSSKVRIAVNQAYTDTRLSPELRVRVFALSNQLAKLEEDSENASRDRKKTARQVPDAPFKNNGWVELIMKRMLRYASENNFDRIAWTTSNQQIDRWSDQIRQNVDQIHWQKNDRQAYADWVYGGRQGQFIAGGVVVNGLKKNNSVFNNTIPLEGETTINGQKVTLEGLLGKQMATQIRNSDKPTGIIEGDNLTIGGQGFKTVYDFAIKKILNKMGKKFGAKVDQVELRKKFLKWDAETQELDKLITFTQPSIPVTRKMKESALKGQPTFRASKMTSTEDVLSSPSFKKWFKGSKVVDENGKPLVVYHGTTGNIEAFSKNKIRPVDSDAPFNGFWFTNETNTSPAWVNPTSILPVYLSIKNPAPFKVIYDEINKMPDYTLKEYEEMGVRSSNDLLRQKLQELGYDGVIFEKSPPFDKLKKSLDKKGVADWKSERGTEYVIKNTPYTDYNGIKRVGIDYYLGSGPYKSGYESYITGYGDFENFKELHSEETYVAFEPTQIKSVFNKGTFNPHDPRISFHMAPKNLVTPLAKIYQEQKGTKKSYTKKNFENDLLRLGYPDDTVKTAMDLFGIIRIKQIETDDPTPIEKELKKIQDLHITRSNLKTRIKRAYTLGAVEKEKEIKKLQEIVTKYATDNLPANTDYQKSELRSLTIAVRDAKILKKLAPAFERIDRVIEKASKRKVLSKWNKTVKKKAKVKKVSGIVRGTVGPDVQDIVNDIRGKKKGAGIMDLSPADVEHKIELMGEIMEASETGEPTDAQAQELNLLLTYGAMKHKTPEEITDATERFDKLVTDGRMQVIEEQQAYKERMAEEIAGMLDVITGGAGSQTQAGAQRLGLNKEGKIEEWKEFFSTLDSDQQSLEYIFDKLSRLDKTSGPLESAINKYFMPRIRQARLAEYNGLVEMQTLLKEKAEEIFKVKGRKLTARLNDNTIGELRVDHLNGIEGEPIFSILSHNQAIKKWMELMDPTLVNTFEKTGWDVEKAKRQIEEQLPKDMLEWGKWQLFEFYPMYYHRVNETFRKRFYVNMPFNSFYSPISRRIGAKADEGDDTLNKSKSPMGSMSTAGSLKGRVSNVEELAWIDGDTTIMKHITEMEHFIHYTELMRELRTVFTNRDISRSIDDFHGKGISRILNKFLDDIARGGVDRANNLMWMDKLRANFSRAVIGANPVVYMKQLASIPAYMADIPILDWNKEFIKLFNPIEIRRMYRTLTKSEMLKMRYDKGFERDMVLALQNVKPGKMITGSNLFNNAMYAFTKMGDKQAIFVGGWPVYKYHLKKAMKAGKSREEAGSIAMKKFEEASLRSQQASDVEDLGDFARRGSAYKLFTMFMTSPNQYYRMVAGGYRNLYYKRGSKSENWRRVFIGQFLLPTLFQFISNGFEWDDKDQAMSVLLFPFSGLLFWGQGFEYLIRSAFNKAYPMGPVAIMTFVQDWGKSLKRMFNGKDLTPEDTLKIIDSFIDGVSKVGGVPYGPAVRTAKGIIKVAKGEAQHPIREAIGFKFKGKKKKKKKKKAKVAQPMFLQ